MIGGKPLNGALIAQYAGVVFLYAGMHTLDTMLRNRVELSNRFVVKRLVMERILYSEIGALQAKYTAVFGEEVRPDQLESRVFDDISLTLHLFNWIIPTTIRTGFTLLGQIRDLYNDRSSLDFLAVARPALVSIINEIIEEVRLRYIEQHQGQQQIKHRSDMTRLVSNIVDGLSEVQVNNMQQYQLQRLDEVARRDIENREGWLTYVDRAYRAVYNRNLLDFVTDVYVVHHVMNQNNIDHETYRKLQTDIDYTTRLARRFYQMIRHGWDIVDAQDRVSQLLNLPNFLDEEASLAKLPTLDFEELCVHRCRFAYGLDEPVVLDIRPTVPAHLSSDQDAQLSFLRGQTYALIGQNRSGKSTLVKLLCKLYLPVSPDDADDSKLDTDSKISPEQVQREELDKTDVLCVGDYDITVNGMNFRGIARSVWRRRISYVAQRPFIFPGTIADNIRVGNLAATDAQVLEAARAAGLFLFDPPKLTVSPSMDTMDLHSEFPMQADPTDAELERELDALEDTLEDSADMDVSVENTLGWRRLDDLTDDCASSAAHHVSGVETKHLLNSAHDRASAMSGIPTVAIAGISQRNQASNAVSKPRSSPLKPWQRNRAWWRQQFKNSVSWLREQWINWIVPFTRPDPELANVDDCMLNNTRSTDTGQYDGDSKHNTQVNDMDVLNMATNVGGTNLSGGFAQSIALARVFLLKEQQIIILDEAMSQMDTIKKREFILPNVLSFVNRHNMTLIVISHDVATVSPLVDHVYMLERGKLIYQGSHTDLVARQAEPYMRLVGLPRVTSSSHASVVGHGTGTGTGHNGSTDYLEDEVASDTEMEELDALMSTVKSKLRM
jgi:ABC-type multidrug transport system fused ATPase/permease subunit